jgi:hypothetical protein
MNVLARGLEVPECRLGTAEEHDHQATRGIVDVDWRRALRSSIFEPCVLTAIDLNQFANAGPSRSWLLDLWRPQPPWQP